MLKMATFMCVLLLLVWRGESASIGSSVSDVDAWTLENATVASRAAISPTKNCSLNSIKSDSETMKLLMKSNAILIDITLEIQSYPTDFLRQKLRGFLNPYFWVYSKGETGISLLLWANTIWSLMQPHCRLGEYEMNATLYDVPRGCLMSLSARDTLLMITTLILDDFETEEKQISNLDESVCYSSITKDEEGYASFVYNCCKRNANDDVICDEATPNTWLTIVIWLYPPTFFMLFFYSPAFLNYLLEEGISTTYKCRISKDPSLLRCDALQDFLKDPSDENPQSNETKVVQIKSEHLVSRGSVPVEFKRMIYNLFACRFYHKNNDKPDNQTNESESYKRMCGDKLGCRKVKMYDCLRLLSKAIFLFMFLLPIFFVFLNFFSEEKDWNEREQLTKKMNYTWSASRKSEFNAMVAFSGICLSILYIFVIMDMLTCGLIWKHTRPTFHRTFQSTVNKNRNRAKKWIKNWLDWRKEDNSCRWWFVPYICLTSFWIIIAGMNLCPLALLFCHLIQARNEQGKCWTVIMILITLNILFGLASWVLFVVYLFFFTVIGIIIYAGSTMQILSGVTLLTLYGWSTFHKVRQDYMNYHSKVFNLLMKKQKENIYQIQEAFQKRKKQTNPASSTNKDLCYIVFVLPENSNGSPASSTATKRMFSDLWISLCDPYSFQNQWSQCCGRSYESMMPQEDSLAEMRQLEINGVFLLIDTDGTQYIPLKFFYRMIEIDSCLAPGIIEVKYYEAFVKYLKIVLFLAVVFIVVLAFSDKYGLSLTNQLLATMAAGFIPRIIELLKRDQTKVEQTDDKFEDKLDEAIKMYQDTLPTMTLELSEETTRCY